MRLELWIDVVGGEFSEKYNDERVVAVGGFEEIDRAILEEFGDEVDNDFDKYFELHAGNDSWTFDTTTIYEHYYREDIRRATSLSRVLGQMLLPQNFGRR